MDRKFFLFITLSFLLLTANMAWNLRNAPPRPPAGAAAPAEGEVADADAAADAADGAGEDEAAAGDDAATDADETAAADDPAGEAADDAEPPVPTEIVTLGSLDRESPYRMLVALTNAGAAVQRIELNEARYLDLHDRTGYLGHLELAAGDGGVVVNAVGAGTPAAVAGLQVGDVILEAGAADRDAEVPQLDKIDTPEKLSLLLATTRSTNKLQLVVSRDGARQALTAQLRRRPLEIIRPESENVRMRDRALPDGFVQPPSFLLTLEQIGRDEIKPDAAELPGVDLTSAAWRIVDRAEDSVTFERRVPERGLTVRKRFALAKLADADRENRDAPAYHLTLDVTIVNDDDAQQQVAYRLKGPNGLPVEGWWYATKVTRSSSAGLRDVTGRYFGADAEQIGPSEIVGGEVEPFESGSLAYMGVDAQYFAAALIPDKKESAEVWINRATPELIGPPPNSRSHEVKYANVSFRLRSKPLPLEPGAEVTHKYVVFAGPKRPNLLAKYQASGDIAHTLNDFVYYGWFGGVARTMVGLLHAFYGFVGNYGIAIVMLTVLVRGLMFPLSRGQAKSMAKMQELRPEMERIKERYKGDQQKQAQAMQQLYRKHNVNPLAGCLPMLIQLPVFIGLYRGLAVDIELRQAPLISGMRWCSNLAAPDMLFDWSGFMPRFITDGQTFLLGLGPYLNVLPLVTIGLFLWQQHMFMPEASNDQAALQQKIMKYMMVFMGFLFYKVPSGLCIYFIASSLWGIGERKLVPMPKAATSGDAAGGSTKSSGAVADDRRSSGNGRAGAGRDGKAKKRR